MKKKKFTALGLVMIVSLQLLTFSGIAQENEVLETQANESKGDEKFKLTDEYLETENHALEQYIELKSEHKNLKKEKDFNDNFGGAYINDDGNLTVLIQQESDFIVNKSTNAVVKFSQNTLDNADEAEIKEENSYTNVLDDTVIYKTAKFSLSYLNSLQKYISAHMDDLGINISAVDEINNVIEIGIGDLSVSEDIIANLNQNFDGFDRDAVNFEIADIERTATTSFPGRALSNSTKGLIATSGFNAKDTATGKYGVVSAGHFASIGDTIKNKNGTVLGKASKSQVSNKIDASFTPFNNSTDYTPTYKINGNSGTVIEGYIKVADLPVGYLITKYGIGEYKDGTVTTSVGNILSVNVSAGNLSNLFSADCISYQGDSGGAIVHRRASDSTGKLLYTLAGITHGYYYTGTDKGYGNLIGVKAGYILAKFDLALYAY